MTSRLGLDVALMALLLTAIVVGILLLRSRAPETMKRKIDGLLLHSSELNSVISQLKMGDDYKANVLRDVRTGLNKFEAHLRVNLNKVIDQAQSDMRWIFECADQPTAQERAKKMTS